jgi:P-type Cu2+ transporter
MNTGNEEKIRKLIMEHNHTQQKYTCPMRPEVVQDKPGNCPKCGMNLIPVKAETNKPVSHQHAENNPLMSYAGHQHNHSSMIADFKKRFYVVLILTMPIMLL